jgi:DNA-binding beta-propeller fold protein YncE
MKGIRAMLKRKKTKKKKKTLGKGAKLFLAFFFLAFLCVGLSAVVIQINKKLVQSKSVEVAVDLEVGGSGEGPGQFKEPCAVATDSEGDFYVTDFGGNRVEKFDPAGKLMFVFGVSGKGPGEFNQPSGLFVDSVGNIYVCDTFNQPNSRIQKFDSDGKFIKEWDHSLGGPRGITGDNQGRIYVVDTGNHRVKVFDSDGNFLKEWGERGSGNGKFDEPVGCAVDPEGNLYVADSNNNRIEKFTRDGKWILSFKVSTWKGKEAERPYLAFHGGYLYATNASEKAVLKYDPSGKFVALFKKKGKESFADTIGIAVDNLDRIYVVERGPNQVARFAIPSLSPAVK